MKIAAKHAKAISEGPGIGVEEGLFLDRIALYAAHVPPRDVESSAPVVTDFANAGLAVGDRATVSACVTTNTVAIEFLVEVTFAHLLVDDFTKGGHGLSVNILRPVRQPAITQVREERHTLGAGARE